MINVNNNSCQCGEWTVQSRRWSHRRMCLSRTCTQLGSWKQRTTPPTANSWRTSSGSVSQAFESTSGFRTSTSSHCTRTSDTMETTSSYWPTRTSASRRKTSFDESLRRSAGRGLWVLIEGSESLRPSAGRAARTPLQSPLSWVALEIWVDSSWLESCFCVLATIFTPCVLKPAS